MAERRMFAKSIISSARFLRMPAASRLLYYDLGMDADDDGVVEAYTVMRKTGANDDDLQILVSKGFVRVLNDDLVSLILDWKTYVMGDDSFPATERAEAKRKLAQLEFHTCLPTVAERADYQDARERAEKYAHELEDCRDALTAARKALKDAIAAEEKRTLQNEKAAQAWVSTQLGRFPETL